MYFKISLYFHLWFSKFLPVLSFCSHATVVQRKPHIIVIFLNLFLCRALTCNLPSRMFCLCLRRRCALLLCHGTTSPYLLGPLGLKCFSNLVFFCWFAGSATCAYLKLRCSVPMLSRNYSFLPSHPWCVFPCVGVWHDVCWCYILLRSWRRVITGLCLCLSLESGWGVYSCPCSLWPS